MREGEHLYAASTIRRLLTRVRRAVGTSNGTAAEDLLQAAFVRLEECRQRTVIHNPEGFIVRVAANLATDEYRRTRTQRFADGSTDEYQWVADPTPLQDEILQFRENLGRVRRAIAELSPRTREIFIMQRFEARKQREIADVCGISVSAVEKHMARAVLAITNALDDDD